MPIKRDRNPYLWQNNVRKRLRQSGQSYVDVTGKQHSERKVIEETCPERCPFKCQFNFDLNDRQDIHKDFWSLTDEKKNFFYSKFVRKQYAARQRTPHKISRRVFSFLYFFDIGEGKRVQVCQKFFFNTLNISRRRIYYYFDNLHDFESGNPKRTARTRNNKVKISNEGENSADKQTNKNDIQSGSSNYE